MKSKLEYITSGIVINDSNWLDELYSFRDLVMMSRSDPLTIPIIDETVRLVKNHSPKQLTKQDIKKLCYIFINIYGSNSLPPLCLPIIFNFLCQHLDQKEQAFQAIDLIVRNILIYFKGRYDSEIIKLCNQTFNNLFLLEALQAIGPINKDNFSDLMKKIETQMNKLVDEDLYMSLLTTTNLPQEVIKEVVFPYNNQSDSLPHQPELGNYLLDQLKTTLQNLNEAPQIEDNRGSSSTSSSASPENLPIASSSSSSFFSSVPDYTREEHVGFELIARLVRERYLNTIIYTQLDPANKAGTTGACMQIIFTGVFSDNDIKKFTRDNNIRVLASGGSSETYERHYITLTREETNTLAKTLSARNEPNSTPTH